MRPEAKNFARRRKTRPRAPVTPFEHGPRTRYGVEAMYRAPITDTIARSLTAESKTDTVSRTDPVRVSPGRAIDVLFRVGAVAILLAGCAVAAWIVVAALQV